MAAILLANTREIIALVSNGKVAILPTVGMAVLLADASVALLLVNIGKLSVMLAGASGVAVLLDVKEATLLLARRPYCSSNPARWSQFKLMPVLA